MSFFSLLISMLLLLCCLLVYIVFTRDLFIESMTTETVCRCVVCLSIDLLRTASHAHPCIHEAMLVLMFFFLHFIHLSCAMLCKHHFFRFTFFSLSLFFLHIWESLVHVIECNNTHLHTHTHTHSHSTQFGLFFVLCLCAKRISESVLVNDLQKMT